jgi:hypothetical protein
MHAFGDNISISAQNFKEETTLIFRNKSSLALLKQKTESKEMNLPPPKKNSTATLARRFNSRGYRAYW